MPNLRKIRKINRGGQISSSKKICYKIERWEVKDDLTNFYSFRSNGNANQILDLIIDVYKVRKQDNNFIFYLSTMEPKTDKINDLKLYLDLLSEDYAENQAIKLYPLRSVTISSFISLFLKEYLEKPLTAWSEEHLKDYGLRSEVYNTAVQGLERLKKSSMHDNCMDLAEIYLNKTGKTTKRVQLLRDLIKKYV